jgi:hypothetical protein
MALTDSLKSLGIETAQSLQGRARRLFMARTVKARGAGGQRRAARARGWGRRTMRTGTRALASGGTCREAFAARGRKRGEVHLPRLLPAIRAIVESHSQAAPPCRPPRLSTRWSAAAVRQQLITPKGYAEDDLPTVHTLPAKLNALGYAPKQVATSQPQKKSPPPTPSSTK